MNDLYNFNLNEGHQEGTGNFQGNNLGEDNAPRVPPRAARLRRKDAKYDIFDPEEQACIIRMMKKETEKVCRGQVWHKVFLAFEPDQYGPIFARTIPRLRPNFDPFDNKKVAQMWKKVTKIIGKKFGGKSENRGGPIILAHELPDFKEQVKNIIKFLKNKCFEAFRLKLLRVVKKIRTKGGRPFNPNVCQKNWWSLFINKRENADLKALWEPIERLSAKNSSNDEEEQDVTFESWENTTMACSNIHSPLNSQEISPQGMGEIIDNNTCNFSEESFPTFEDDFGCVTNMAGYLSSEGFPQNQEVNFLQAPGYPNFGQLGQENRGGMGYAREKVLMEYDDTYKLKVFNDDEWNLCLGFLRECIFIHNFYS